MLKTILPIIAASFFIGFVSVQAQNPDQNPPSQNTGAPLAALTVGSQNANAIQVKLGGLGINMTQLNPIGLFIDGDPAAGLGRFTLAQVGFAPTGGIREQVEVQGNVRVSGTITPNGDAGEAGQVLERTDAGGVLGDTMMWGDRGWLTLMGDWSPTWNCSGASPLLCGAFGLKEYQLLCLSQQPGYSVWVRVCEQ